MTPTYRYVPTGTEREPGTVTVRRDARGALLVHPWRADECSCALGRPELVVGPECTLSGAGPGTWRLTAEGYDLSGVIVDVPEPAPWEAP